MGKRLLPEPPAQRAVKLARNVCGLKIFRRAKMQRNKSSAKTEACDDGGASCDPRSLTGHLTLSCAGRVVLADLLDGAACRRWVLERLHPAGPRCPGCDEFITDATTLANFWSGARCVCKTCGKWFTAVSGTFLQGSRLDCKQIFIIALFADILASGLDVGRIAAAAGASSDTVRIWIKRFKAFE